MCGLKIHWSEAEENGWISIDKEIPEPYLKVKTCSINIIDWNMENILWQSVGHITKNGNWSISVSDTATKDKVFKYKITHWKK